MKIEENINLQRHKIDKIIQTTMAQYGRLQFILIPSIWQQRMVKMGSLVENPGRRHCFAPLFGIFEHNLC